MRILLKFSHGMGDCVQFGIVLKHVRHYYPDWVVDVECKSDKVSCFAGLAHNVYSDDLNPAPGGYDKVYNLPWWEPGREHLDCPSTKPAACIVDEFGLKPASELFKYQVTIPEEKRQRAKEYVHSFGKPVVLIHLHGNSGKAEKDLDENDMRYVCNCLIQAGYVPVILDWDYRNHLADNKTIFCPDKLHPLWDGKGTGNAAMVAALCESASLFIGIDSGPAHVAASTSVPGIVVWTGHHPINFFDLSDFTHLVPGDGKRHIRGDVEKAFWYFTEHYRHKTYQSLHTALMDTVCEKLGIENTFSENVMATPYCLQAVRFDESYYREHKDAGLDYLAYGDWQRDYGRWLVESLGIRGKAVLDVGCACGALAWAFQDAGAVSQACDVNEYSINLGRGKYPIALYVAGAENLHYWPDNSFDLVHAMQTFEHFRPSHVSLILKELRRVTKPGGLLFTVHDTEELFGRQKRLNEPGDPTHTCIKSTSWWGGKLRFAGWRGVKPEYEARLRGHPSSYLQKYDWDWMICQRPH